MPILPINETDLPRLKELQPQGWGDITDSFEMYLESNLFNPLKEEENNIIRGIANSTNYGETAWLSHIIVREIFRGNGLGLTMVNYLLDYLDNKGVETVSLLATEMGRPVYLRAGFRDQGKYIIFTREEVPSPVVISPLIEPFDESCITGILSIDRYVAGEVRAALIAKHLEKALVYRKNRLIEGYFLPGLGEGPIAALTPEAGLALLEYKIIKEKRVVIPAENKIAIQFLLNRGFKKEKVTVMRMVRGREFPWKPKCLYSRIGGKLG